MTDYQYYTDFAPFAVNVFPQGFTAFASPSSRTRLVISESVALAGKAYREALVLTTTLNSATSLVLRTQDVSPAMDFDVVARYRVDHANATLTQRGGIVARGGLVPGLSTTARGYILGFGSGNWALSKSSGTTHVLLGNLAGAPGLPANTWVWLRLRVIGARIQGRVWLDGSPEPNVWHADVTDPTPFTDAAYAGISSPTNNVNSGTNHFWDALSILSGNEIPMSGRVPPAPVITSPTAGDIVDQSVLVTWTPS
jgi:hypothetical protein